MMKNVKLGFQRAEDKLDVLAALPASKDDVVNIEPRATFSRSQVLALPATGTSAPQCYVAQNESAKPLGAALHDFTINRFQTAAAAATAAADDTAVQLTLL